MSYGTGNGDGGRDGSQADTATDSATATENSQSDSKPGESLQAQDAAASVTSPSTYDGISSVGGWSTGAEINSRADAAAQRAGGPAQAAIEAPAIEAAQWDNDKNTMLKVADFVAPFIPGVGTAWSIARTGMAFKDKIDNGETVANAAFGTLADKALGMVGGKINGVVGGALGSGYGAANKAVSVANMLGADLPSLNVGGIVTSAMRNGARNNAKETTQVANNFDSGGWSSGSSGSSGPTTWIPDEQGGIKPVATTSAVSSYDGFKPKYFNA